MNTDIKNNVYIGMRYVPKIIGEWDNTLKYEPLSIVLYQGNSYTSKTFVPVGADILDTQFWVLSGNYNGQVAELENEIEENRNNISDLTAKVNNNTTNITELDGFVKQNTTNITNLTQTVNSNTLKITQHNTTLNQHETEINALQDLVDNNTDDITSLTTKVNTNITNINNLTNNFNTTTMVGKSVCFIGDDLAAGYINSSEQATINYPIVFRTLSKATVTNLGSKNLRATNPISGTAPTLANVILNNTFNNYDSVFIQIGIHDFIGNAPIQVGLLSDANTSYFKNAIYNALSLLQTKIKTTCGIYLIGLLPSRWFYNKQIYNSNNIYNYIEALKDVALETNTSYIDVLNNCGINKFNYTNFFTSDYLMNEAGYIKVGETIFKSFQSSSTPSLKTSENLIDYYSFKKELTTNFHNQPIKATKLSSTSSNFPIITQSENTVELFENEFYCISGEIWSDSFDNSVDIGFLSNQLFYPIDTVSNIDNTSRFNFIFRSPYEGEYKLCFRVRKGETNPEVWIHNINLSKGNIQNKANNHYFEKKFNVTDSTVSSHTNYTYYRGDMVAMYAQFTLSRTIQGGEILSRFSPITQFSCIRQKVVPYVNYSNNTVAECWVEVDYQHGTVKAFTPITYVLGAKLMIDFEIFLPSLNTQN